MKNQVQTRVLVLLAVLLASQFLGSESLASITSSISQTNTPSYSWTTSPTGSYSNTNSMSVTNTMSVSITGTVSGTMSLSLSTSYSLTQFFTVSTSLTASVSNSFIPTACQATAPKLDDRCVPQVTVGCMFFPSSTTSSCPQTTNSDRFYRVMLTNSSGGHRDIDIKVPAGELPQYPLDTYSTQGFCQNGVGQIMIQVVQITGIRGNPISAVSNTVIKNYGPDNRSPLGRCTTYACRVVCSLLGTNSAQCNWILGTERIKRVVLSVTNCVSLNNFQSLSLQYRRPPYFFRSKRFQRLNSATVSLPRNALCVVKVCLRYPAQLKKIRRRRVQICSKYGIFSQP
jgi:hypothetical protein